jgi:hypothetical protein
VVVMFLGIEHRPSVPSSSMSSQPVACRSQQHERKQLEALPVLDFCTCFPSGYCFVAVAVAVVVAVDVAVDVAVVAVDVHTTAVQTSRVQKSTT